MQTTTGTSEHQGAEADDELFAAYEVARTAPDGRPWLFANMVAGLDGSLAWEGRVGALSSDLDRRLFVHLRSLADAVVVGASTVREESYGPVRLTAAQRARRAADGQAEVPPLVVVTRSLALDWEAPLFAEPGPSRPIVVTAASAPADARRRAEDVADVVVAGDERVDIAEAMAALADRGHRVALTEGGPTLLGEMVDHEVLDELCLTITPVLGGDPLTMAHRPESARGLVAFHLATVRQAHDELFLRYLAVPGPPSEALEEGRP